MIQPTLVCTISRSRPERSEMTGVVVNAQMLSLWTLPSGAPTETQSIILSSILSSVRLSCSKVRRVFDNPPVGPVFLVGGETEAAGQLQSHIHKRASGGVDEGV